LCRFQFDLKAEQTSVRDLYSETPRKYFVIAWYYICNLHVQHTF